MANYRVLVGSIAFGISFSISLLANRDFGKAVFSGITTVPATLVALNLVDRLYYRRSEERLVHLQQHIRSLQRQRAEISEEYAYLAAEKDRVALALNSMQMHRPVPQLPAASVAHRAISWNLSEPAVARPVRPISAYGLPTEIQEPPRHPVSSPGNRASTVLTQRLETRLNAVQSEISELQEQLAGERQAKDKLVQEIAELDQQKQELESQTQTLETQTQTLKNELQGLEQCRLELEQFLNNAEAKKRQLETESNPLQVALKQLQNQIASLRQEQHQLAAQVAERKQEKENLDRQLAVLRQEQAKGEALQKEQRQLEAQVAERKQEKENLDRQLAVLRQEQAKGEALQKEQRQLEAQVAERKQEKENLERQLANFRTQQVALKPRPTPPSEASGSSQGAVKPAVSVSPLPNQPHSPRPVVANQPRSPMAESQPQLQANSVNKPPSMVLTRPAPPSEKPVTPQLSEPARPDANSQDLPNEWTEFMVELPEYEFQVLKAIAEEANPAAILKKIAEDNLTMPEVLIEGINERALDTIGDLVIEPGANAGSAMIVREYGKLVKKLIQTYEYLVQ